VRDRSTDHYSCDTSSAQDERAHEARLNSRKQGTRSQIKGVESSASFLYRSHLGVGREIIFSSNGLDAFSDDMSIANDDRAHRRLASIASQVG
jgi:hypothetical protein